MGNKCANEKAVPACPTVPKTYHIAYKHCDRLVYVQVKKLEAEDLKRRAAELFPRAGADGHRLSYRACIDKNITSACEFYITDDCSLGPMRGHYLNAPDRVLIMRVDKPPKGLADDVGRFVPPAAEVMIYTCGPCHTIAEEDMEEDEGSSSSEEDEDDDAAVVEGNKSA